MIQRNIVRSSVSLAAIALFLPAGAFAQTTGPGSNDPDGTAMDDPPVQEALDEEGRGEAAHHGMGGDPSTIVVTGALPQRRQDVLSGVAVLDGEELTRDIRPSIGETLRETPGVSTTYFGPSASRPVLRGLQGERVRVLTNGLGSIDVSNTSVDHAVVVNPLTAERIEVLRGPQSLLYGSAAIGGVVNVIDRSLPRFVPDEPVELDGIATYGSAATELSGGAAAQVKLTDHVVVTADGSYLHSDNVRIGGYALTPALRRQALATAALPVTDPDAEEPIDFAGNADVRGRLPNSQAETWTAGGGIAYIDDGGSLAFAYKHYDSLYGVPIRFATRPGEEQEAPRLDVAQNRYDLRAEALSTGPIISKVTARLGYANYRHFELEEDGEIGTAFYNQGLEGRLELTQARHGIWQGVTGGQLFVRDFNVVGEEAFLPKNSTVQVGLFTLQQFNLDPIKIEAGLRYEHSDLQARPLADQPQFFSGDRRFDAFSGSLGASYALNDGIRLGVNVSRSERTPAAEELFANGPHAGTQAFEVGNPDFDLEKAWSVEGIARANGRNFSLEASVYYTWFDDFIYEDQTGAIEDGLPVYQFRQAPARYYGFEVQGNATLARIGGTRILVDGLADYVHARIEDVGPAPRIPPLRLLGGIGIQRDGFDLRGEVEHVFDQDRTSDFETPTDSFTLVNVEANVHPLGPDSPISLVLSANNIFDVNARRHASFLKDYAPLPGRDFRVTARVNF